MNWETRINIYTVLCINIRVFICIYIYRHTHIYTLLCILCHKESDTTYQLNNNNNKCIKWRANENLLYSTETPPGALLWPKKEGNPKKRGYMYKYVWFTSLYSRSWHSSNYTPILKKVITQSGEMCDKGTLKLQNPSALYWTFWFLKLVLQFV